MKIAIYGDSYGCMVPVNKKLNNDKAWFMKLAEHKSIDNYSEGGASLYYSYKMFLENKHKYDKNIVLGSFNSRRYAQRLSWKHINFSIVDCPEIWKNHGLSQEEINAYILYYKYVYNSCEEQDIRSLIEKEIKSFPNTLYISIPDTLHRVTLREREYFKYNATDKENMGAHMTASSNDTTFETILKWIDIGEFNFNLDNYKLPNKQDRYKYYI